MVYRTPRASGCAQTCPRTLPVVLVAARITSENWDGVNNLRCPSRRLSPVGAPSRAQSAMRFAVRFLRYRGRIVPYREVVNKPALFGELRIEECHDDELHRYVRTATLHRESASTYRADVPRLYDVRLMAMSPQAFTLTGLERIDGVEYAQSWLVT